MAVQTEVNLCQNNIDDQGLVTLKLVSVIVPVYNVAKYITATIQSVLSQTYENFELLLIDDGSPDNSVAICQQFDDSRIKIIRQPNRGLSAARNAGIRNSQGDYLAFLDGDDLWLPDKLTKHVAHLNQSGEIGVSYSASAFINENGDSLGIYQIPQLQNVTLRDILCRNPIGNGSTPVIRREVLEEIAFEANLYGTVETFYFDDQFRYSQDIECWSRIAAQTNWQMAGIGEALTLYRVNSGGLSANLMKKFASVEQILAKARYYAPKEIAQCEQAVKAYHLRYLARRAVSLRDGKTAIQLAHRAINTYWQLWREEPMRTALTLAAAYTLYWLPQSFYVRLETMAMKQTGKSQQRQFFTSRPHT